MIRIELLSAENFTQDSLDNYPRKQDVKKNPKRAQRDFDKGIGYPSIEERM